MIKVFFILGILLSSLITFSQSEKELTKEFLLLFQDTCSTLKYAIEGRVPNTEHKFDVPVTRIYSKSDLLIEIPAKISDVLICNSKNYCLYQNYPEKVIYHCGYLIDYSDKIAVVTVKVIKALDDDETILLTIDKKKLKVIDKVWVSSSKPDGLFMMSKSEEHDSFQVFSAYIKGNDTISDFLIANVSISKYRVDNDTGHICKEQDYPFQEMAIEIVSKDVFEIKYLNK